MGMILPQTEHVGVVPTNKYTLEQQQDLPNTEDVFLASTYSEDVDRVNREKPQGKTFIEFCEQSYIVVKNKIFSVLNNLSKMLFSRSRNVETKTEESKGVNTIKVEDDYISLGPDPILKLCSSKSHIDKIRESQPELADRLEKLAKNLETKQSIKQGSFGQDDLFLCLEYLAFNNKKFFSDRKHLIGNSTLIKAQLEQESNELQQQGRDSSKVDCMYIRLETFEYFYNLSLDTVNNSV